MLLALGLSQVPIPAIVFVFAWLLFLGWREKTPELSHGWFNLRQLALVGVTLIAPIILGVSVYEGLLGQPEMQVRGNGSSATLLRWFMDRTEEFGHAGGPDGDLPHRRVPDGKIRLDSSGPGGARVASETRPLNTYVRWSIRY